MPLIIGENKLQTIPTSLEEFFESHPCLKESALALFDTPKREVGPQNLLYIDQREYAATMPDDKLIKILGSADATTCHIVVLRHSVTHATCLGHLDGCGTKDGLHGMLQLVQKLSNHCQDGRIEAHLVGGFNDDKKLSMKLSLEIFNVLQEMDIDIHLVCACITDLNNVRRDDIDFPAIYGIAVDVVSGDVYHATFQSSHTDRTLRAARHFTGAFTMMNVYDNENSLLTIGPFNYEPFQNIDLWIKLPDPIILQYLSTSPEQEPPHFVANVRRTLQFIEKHPAPLETVFTNGKPRLYKIQDDGSWLRVNNGEASQAEAASDSVT